MSTESPQPKDSESIEKRAMDEMMDVPASRRGVLRGIGAAGTAAVAGSSTIAATGAAQEDDGSEDDEGMDIMSPTLAKYGMVADVSQSITNNLFGSEDLPEDEIELHGEFTYQHQSIENYYVMVNNNLERTIDIATIDARHAIASAYERGDDAGTAYSDAMTAMREYYALHEEQHLKILQFELMQIATGSEKVRQNDNIDSMFLHATVEPVEPGTGTDYDTMLLYHDEENTEESTFVLEDGTETSLQMPQMECRVHESDSTRDPDIGTTDLYPIDQDLLDSWMDVGEEEWFVWEDDAGVQYDSVLDFVFMSTEDPNNEGETLQEPRVLLEMREWMDRYHQIKNQSDTATARFDQTMVDDMYALMDEGVLEPSDVRGAEGLAQFMAGEDSEVGSDAYKLAIYNMLDLGQPDLSEVANMQITYSGFTDEEPVYNDAGERNMQPSGQVEDRQYSGLLYTDQTPEGGLQTGSTYVVNDSGLVGFTSGSTYHINTGGELTGQSVFDTGNTNIDAIYMDAIYNSDGSYIAVSPNFVLVFDGSGNQIYEHDRTDVGSTDVYASAVVAGNVLRVLEDGRIYLDDFDGSNVFSRTDQTMSISDVSPVAVDSDDNMYIAGNGEILSLKADGTENWNRSDSMSGPVQGLFLSDDESSLFYSSDGVVYSMDVDSGSINFDVELAGQDDSFSARLLAFSSTNDALYAFADGTCYFIDSSDGSVLDEVQVGSTPDVFGGFTRPCSIFAGNLYLPGSPVTVVNLETASVSTLDADNEYLKFSSQPTDFDGEIHGPIQDSMFYDAQESEELWLSGGYLTVDKMLTSEGDEIDESQEWDGDPDYATIDNEEFVEYTEQQTELIETIENGGQNTGDEDVNITVPEITWPDLFPDVPGSDNPGSLLGVALVALVVVSIAWSVLTEFIPFVGK